MEFLQSVGILDIIFIAILVISILVGLIRGAVREVLSLLGLVIAIYLAFKFADVVSKEYILQFFEQQPRISYIIAFVIIITVTIFVIALVNLLISQLLKASGLSFVDRLLGLVFGVLRGGLFCTILVMVIGFIPGVTKKTWWQSSTLAPFFQKIAARSYAYVPKEVTDYFNKNKEIKRNTGRIVKPLFGADAIRGADNETDADATKKHVGNILQSIDNSLQETKQPETQQENELQENTGTASEEKKLSFESF